MLGTPQGLAVYQNGVRINEAFGNTVNWDLFPDIAINQVELVSSSPIYGLNALGGAISVTMKNGFTYQGADVELSGGSYGQRAVTAQYGMNSGAFGFYVAGRALDWDGWRQFSNDRMRDVYAVLSMHTDAATFDLSFTRADNAMNGQGPSPVQELAVEPLVGLHRPADQHQYAEFRDAERQRQADRYLVAADRCLLPPIQSDGFERQHHRLRSLHQHARDSVPAGRRDAADQTRPGRRCRTSPTAARHTSARTTTS